MANKEIKLLINKNGKRISWFAQKNKCRHAQSRAIWVGTFNRFENAARSQRPPLNRVSGAIVCKHRVLKGRQRKTGDLEND